MRLLFLLPPTAYCLLENVSVEIISVGSKFIIQDLRDSGIAVIANRLLENGIEVNYVSSVSPQEARLEEILRQAIIRSKLIFVLGGEGSGEYDTAKKLLTRVLKKRLVLNYKVLDRIKAGFQERGDIMPRTAEKQALVPTDAEILEDEKSSVAGFLFRHELIHVVLLPDNPQQIARMLHTHILPRLDPKTFRVGSANGFIFKTCGLSHTQIKDYLRGLERDERPPALNYVIDGEETSIIVTVKGDIQTDVDKRLKSVKSKIRKKLGNYLYGTGSQTLEEVVGKLLIKLDASVALAESCTGGLIAHKLTNVPGSSQYFERGVVSYSNEAKIALLDVSPNIIEQHGAVSEETAIAMAEGVRWIAQTAYGLAVTGIAGPSGGTAAKPVGLVYIALAMNGAETQCKKYQFSGDRVSVKMRTAQTALNMLRNQLLTEK